MHDFDAPQPTLLLADGMAIVRRCYKAQSGEDTPARAKGALEAAHKSIMRALREHEPTHFLVPFDHGGKTFRHRLYEHYKAHREPMPDVLSEALPAFFEQLQASGICTARIPDVEADDVIGSVATNAVSRGYKVIVTLSDKDMFRLIDEGVVVYDHWESQERDRAFVMRKFGVEPSQMTDFLALMGDSTDGIPGVKAIGEKKAAALLQQYKTLDAALEASSSMQGQVGVALRNGREDALLSRELVRLKLDVKVGIKPSQMQLPAALVALIAEMPEPKHVRVTRTGKQAAQVLSERQLRPPATPRMTT